MIGSFLLSFDYLSENRRRTFPQPFVCVWARAIAMFSLLGSCVAALALYGLMARMALLHAAWKLETKTKDEGSAYEPCKWDNVFFPLVAASLEAAESMAASSVATGHATACVVGSWNRATGSVRDSNWNEVPYPAELPVPSSKEQSDFVPRLLVL